MFSPPQLRRLSAFVLLLSLTHASWLNLELFGSQNEVRAVEAGTSSTSATVAQTSAKVPPTSSTSTTSSTISTTAPPSTTSKQSTTSAPPTTSTTVPPTTSASTTAAPPTTSNAPPTTSTDAPTQPPSTTTNDSPPTTSAPTTQTIPTSEPVSLVTFYTTISGSAVTSVSSSTVSSPSATGTDGTSLASSNTPSPSGMTTKTRNTVIGVVVGVGGAVILAGLGIVAYRIWGRKKPEDDDDGLMGFRTGSGGHEKVGSVSANTGVTGGQTANPFQSTLENYHNPAKQVNASSNF